MFQLKLLTESLGATLFLGRLPGHRHVQSLPFNSCQKARRSKWLCKTDSSKLLLCHGWCSWEFSKMTSLCIHLQRRYRTRGCVSTCWLLEKVLGFTQEAVVERAEQGPWFGSHRDKFSLQLQQVALWFLQQVVVLVGVMCAGPSRSRKRSLGRWSSRDTAGWVVCTSCSADLLNQQCCTPGGLSLLGY